MSTLMSSEPWARGLHKPRSQMPRGGEPPPNLELESLKMLKEGEVGALSHTSCLLPALSRLPTPLPAPGTLHPSYFSVAFATMPTLSKSSLLQPPASRWAPSPVTPDPAWQRIGCSGTRVSWAGGRAVRSCLSTPLRVLGRRDGGKDQMPDPLDLGLPRSL